MSNPTVARRTLACIARVDLALALILFLLSFDPVARLTCAVDCLRLAAGIAAANAALLWLTRGMLS